MVYIWCHWGSPSFPRWAWTQETRLAVADAEEGTVATRPKCVGLHALVTTVSLDSLITSFEGELLIPRVGVVVGRSSHVPLAGPGPTFPWLWEVPCFCSFSLLRPSDPSGRCGSSFPSLLGAGDAGKGNDSPPKKKKKQQPTGGFLYGDPETVHSISHSLSHRSQVWTLDLKDAVSLQPSRGPASVTRFGRGISDIHRRPVCQHVISLRNSSCLGCNLHQPPHFELGWVGVLQEVRWLMLNCFPLPPFACWYALVALVPARHYAIP